MTKLSDAETEVSETQVWIEFAHRCGYLEQVSADELETGYDKVIGQLVTMIRDSDKWLIR